MSDYIHHDLQRLILTKFPARTLLRCRCVCKAWKDLIDSRTFLLDHLAAQTPRVIAQPDDKRMPFHIFHPHTFPLFHELPQIERNRFDDDDGTTFLSLVASVHGVVCLYDYENLLLLWNPSIGRVLRLPLPEFNRAHEHFCGFWIDPSNNDFKVVIFLLHREKIALFSSKKEAWTEMPVDFARFTWIVTSRTRAPQILVEGVGHWLLSDFDRNDYRVPYFDFGQDKFGTIEFPPEWGGHYCSIIKWGGCVSVVHRDYDEPGVCGDLWALRDGSWSKMFRFRVDDDTQTVVSYGVGNYGRVLAKTCRGYLVLYDPKKGCARLMSESIQPRPLGWFNVAYDFVESLVFPDSVCDYSGSL